jgi:hypothetical protein
MKMFLLMKGFIISRNERACYAVCIDRTPSKKAGAGLTSDLARCESSDDSDVSSDNYKSSSR